MGRTTVAAEADPVGRRQQAVHRRCRFCQAPLTRSVVDLGKSPLANSFLTPDDLTRPEQFYPLHVFICDDCFLVQLGEIENPKNIFDNYLYFSSYSQSWLDHARTYALEMRTARALSGSSLVVEIASNDGYLLQFFKQLGIPVLGVEPAANVAAAARAKGIPTEIAFFGRETAKRLVSQGKSADLIVANNVLAHVPDLNDFVGGFKTLLKPDGIATLEFPHLLNLIAERQFDTIYHEHFSYFSLSIVDRIFSRHGLHIFDAEQLPTHGGSLRIHLAHAKAKRPRHSRFGETIAAERAARLDRFETYRDFAEAVVEVKCGLLEFLWEARGDGKTVAGYGAPAKGNTLLNFCGIGPHLLPFTVDRNEHKQGRYLPGVHIPIHAPQRIVEAMPDYLLILPWNIKEEIVKQMSDIRRWGGKFVVAIPNAQVF